MACNLLSNLNDAINYHVFDEVDILIGLDFDGISNMSQKTFEGNFLARKLIEGQNSGCNIKATKHVPQNKKIK